MTAASLPGQGDPVPGGPVGARATGVHHVCVPVRDLDEALDFYVGPLGLTVRTGRPVPAPGGAPGWTSAARPETGSTWKR